MAGPVLILCAPILFYLVYLHLFAGRVALSGLLRATKMYRYAFVAVFLFSITVYPLIILMDDDYKAIGPVAFLMLPAFIVVVFTLGSLNVRLILAMAIARQVRRGRLDEDETTKGRVLTSLRRLRWFYTAVFLVYGLKYRDVVATLSQV